MIKNSKTFTLFITISFLALAGCNNQIERKGVVIDKVTKEPMQNVSIDIYMKSQKRDSLKDDVFTDSIGHYHIKEKREVDQLFLVYKTGYVGFTSSLSILNDTIRMERIKDRY